MKRSKIIILSPVILLFFLVITNPNKKDFEEYRPTELELVSNNYPDTTVSYLTFKKKNNFFIFSTFEFQYILVKKIRIFDKSYESFWYQDGQGEYIEKQITIKREYLGFMKNFKELK